MGEDHVGLLGLQKAMELLDRFHVLVLNSIAASMGAGWAEINHGSFRWSVPCSWPLQFRTGKCICDRQALKMGLLLRSEPCPLRVAVSANQCSRAFDPLQNQFDGDPCRL